MLNKRCVLPFTYMANLSFTTMSTIKKSISTYVRTLPMLIILNEFASWVWQEIELIFDCLWTKSFMNFFESSSLCIFWNKLLHDSDAWIIYWGMMSESIWSILIIEKKWYSSDPSSPFLEVLLKYLFQKSTIHIWALYILL